MHISLSTWRNIWTFTAIGQYAQALYQYYTQGRELPPVQGRLKRNTYDRDAAERVSWSLGHNRIDVVLRHYLR